MNTQSKKFLFVIIMVTITLLILAAGFFTFRDPKVSGSNPVSNVTSSFNTDECLKNTSVNDECWFSLSVPEEDNCITRCKEKSNIPPSPITDEDTAKLLSYCRKGCENGVYGYAKDSCISSCDFTDCTIKIDNNGETKKQISEFMSCIAKSAPQKESQIYDGTYFQCLMNEIRPTRLRYGMENCADASSKAISYDDAVNDCRKLAAQLGLDCPPETCCRK